MQQLVEPEALDSQVNAVNLSSVALCRAKCGHAWNYGRAKYPNECESCHMLRGLSHTWVMKGVVAKVVVSLTASSGRSFAHKKGGREGISI